MNFKKILKSKFTYIVIVFVIRRLGNAKLYQIVEGQQGAYGN